MNAQYPNTEPRIIASGGTIVWTKDLPSFPPPSYTLGYRLVGTGGVSTASVNVDGLRFEVTLTTALAAGMYKLIGWVTDGAGAVTVIYESSIEVTPNLITGAAQDTRSYWQQVLDAVNAVMLNRASLIQKSMSVPGAGSRSIEYMDPDQLYTLQKRCEYEIRRIEDRERVAMGKSRRQIKIVFL